jgi:hypothetical protein
MLALIVLLPIILPGPPKDTQIYSQSTVTMIAFPEEELILVFFLGYIFYIFLNLDYN